MAQYLRATQPTFGMQNAKPNTCLISTALLTALVIQSPPPLLMKQNAIPSTWRRKDPVIIIIAYAKGTSFRQLKSKKLQHMILSFDFVT